jgi:hypothetical protein
VTVRSAPPSPSALTNDFDAKDVLYDSLNGVDYVSFFLGKGVSRVDADHARRLVQGEGAYRVERATGALGEGNGRAAQIMEAPIRVSKLSTKAFHAVRGPGIIPSLPTPKIKSP